VLLTSALCHVANYVSMSSLSSQEEYLNSLLLQQTLFTYAFGSSPDNSCSPHEDGQDCTIPSEVFTLSLCCTHNELVFVIFLNNSSKLQSVTASWVVLGLVVASDELASLLWDGCSNFCATSQRDNLFLPYFMEARPPINTSSMTEIS